MRVITPVDHDGAVGALDLLISTTEEELRALKTARRIALRRRDDLSREDPAGPRPVLITNPVVARERSPEDSGDVIDQMFEETKERAWHAAIRTLLEDGKRHPMREVFTAATHAAQGAVTYQAITKWVGRAVERKEILRPKRGQYQAALKEVKN